MKLSHRYRQGRGSGLRGNEPWESGVSLGFPYLVSSLQGPPGHLVGSVVQEMDELASVNALGCFLSGFRELEKTHHSGAELECLFSELFPHLHLRHLLLPKRSFLVLWFLSVYDFVLSQNRDDLTCKPGQDWLTIA